MITNGYFMPRLISISEFVTIPYVGISGQIAWIAYDGNLPLSAAFMELQECHTLEMYSQ